MMVLLNRMLELLHEEEVDRDLEEGIRCHVE